MGSIVINYLFQNISCGQENAFNGVYRISVLVDGIFLLYSFLRDLNCLVKLVKSLLILKRQKGKEGKSVALLEKTAKPTKERLSPAAPSNVPALTVGLLFP